MRFSLSWTYYCDEAISQNHSLNRIHLRSRVYLVSDMLLMWGYGTITPVHRFDYVLTYSTFYIEQFFYQISAEMERRQRARNNCGIA